MQDSKLNPEAKEFTPVTFTPADAAPVNYGPSCPPGQLGPYQVTPEADIQPVLMPPHGQYYFTCQQPAVWYPQVPGLPQAAVVPPALSYPSIGGAAPGLFYLPSTGMMPVAGYWPQLQPQVIAAPVTANAPAPVMLPPYNYNDSSIVRKQLHQGFGFLKGENPKLDLAEPLFRRLVAIPEVNKEARLGLARALMGLGGQPRNLEALNILEQLQSETLTSSINGQGLSSYTDVDLTLARIYATLGQWTKARRLLQALALSARSGLDSNDWETACGIDKIDMVRVRLLEDCQDYHTAAALLQDMAIIKSPWIATDDLCTPCGSHDIDLARVYIYQKLGLCRAAQDLLQKMAQIAALRNGKEIAIDDLTTPCGEHRIDISRIRLLVNIDSIDNAETMIETIIQEKYPGHPIADGKPCDHESLNHNWLRLLLFKGNFDKASKLLQGMAEEMARKRQRIMNSQDPCSPCGDYSIDLARFRLLRLLGQAQNAANLLYATALGRCKDLKPNDWITSCGIYSIDIARARFSQERGDYKAAGELLKALSIIHASDSATMEKLEHGVIVSCGHPELDMYRIHLFMLQGDLTSARQLMQATTVLQSEDKSLGVDDLTLPSGQLELDLSRARLLQKSEDYAHLETLVTQCSRYYPWCHDFRKIWLISLAERKLWQRFEQERAQFAESHPKASNCHSISLAESICYYLQALYHFDSHTSGESDTSASEKGKKAAERALEIIEDVYQRYPDSASALIQKVRCLRLLGREKEQWDRLLRRAEHLDPPLYRLEPLVSWKALEQRVLDQRSKALSSAKQSQTYADRLKQQA